MRLVISSAVRTPIGAFQGAFSSVTAAELGAAAVAEAVRRAGVAPDGVDLALIGNVLQAGQGQAPGRQAVIKAGLAESTPAVTLNKMCGSGLEAVIQAGRAILAGDAQVVVTGGMESMTNAPYLIRKGRSGYRMGNGELVDSMIYEGLTDIFNGYHMGITAENIAERYKLTREEQDAFAAASQNKAEAAMASGRFKDEIVPVLIPQKKGDALVFDRDEFPRAGVTAEALAKLRPAFKPDGTVTAGNSSGINDGAAALVVASEAAAKTGKPLARIVSYGWSGVDPAVMGLGPIEATRLALKRAGWKLADVDLIEANEAFAAQSLAVARDLEFDMGRVNVNGGAIALGHPIGASGARILVTLLHEMGKRKAKKGLATLCIGGGMGIALCVEAV